MGSVLGVGQRRVPHATVRAGEAVAGFVRKRLVGHVACCCECVPVRCGGGVRQHAQDGTVDDGCTFLPVLRVNDDVPSQPVTLVPVRRMRWVGGFCERNDPCGVPPVDQDQIPRVDAPNFPVAVVHHRGGFNDNEGGHRPRVEPQSPDEE